MESKVGIVVRCPKCGNWVMRVERGDATVETNCASSRCRVALSVKVEDGKVTVSEVEKPTRV